jgi:hypothetical protein
MAQDRGGTHQASIGIDALRRFPPPWSVEDIGAAFVVRDQNGQALSYVGADLFDHQMRPLD